MSNWWRMVVLSMGAAAALGCSDDSRDTAEVPSASMPIGDVESPVGLGDRGPSVRAVHDFLMRYGYFENAELRAAYPRWIPVLTSTPASPDVFDDVLEQAVLAYQRLNGLAQTGIVDATTLELMKQPRCGHPDFDPERIDPEAKFDFTGTYWTKDALTYRFLASTLPPTISQPQYETCVANALNAWQAVTRLTFTKIPTSQQADMQLLWPSNWGSNDPPAKSTWTHVNGALLYTLTEFNRTKIATTTALQNLATHEFGHVIGLEHSSFSSSIMYPSVVISQPRSVVNEDILAANAIYPAWEQMPGLPGSQTATGLSVSPDNWVWALGSTAVTGGRRVYRQDNTAGWLSTSQAFGALSIAAGDSGNLYFVDNANRIKRWQWNSGAPVTLVGTARLIAYGGTIPWVLGVMRADDSGYPVYRWNGSTWSHAPGRNAVDLAVDWTGKAWIAEEDGTMWRWNGSTWDSLPGLSNDIGISSAGTWIVSRTPYGQQGNYQLMLWNEQGNSGGAIPQKRWWPILTGAQRVAVSSTGRPWIVYQGVVFRGRRD